MLHQELVLARSIEGVQVSIPGPPNRGGALLGGLYTLSSAPKISLRARSYMAWTPLGLPASSIISDHWGPRCNI